MALRLRHARTPERQLDGADVDAVRQEAAGAFVTEVVAMQIDLPEFLEIDASAAFVFGTDNGEYMELRHHVPAARMTRGYYWRWWYWKGDRPRAHAGSASRLGAGPGSAEGAARGAGPAVPVGGGRA